MAKLTPMMAQYMSIKSNHKDAILMFRLGDFYEMFFEDAKTASKVLEIALTARDCGLPEKAAMCGVPVHAVDNYIARLVDKGYKVAMCDQVEDAKFAKGLVKRDVVRIITPGTVTDLSLLDEGKHNYVACVWRNSTHFGLAAADITTGLFMATSMADEQKLIDEIMRIVPAEIISTDGFPLTKVIESLTGKTITTAPSWTFQPANATKVMNDHFGTFHLEGFGLVLDAPETVCAGALLAYIMETQKGVLAQITSIKTYAHQTHMLLDASSRRNLELTASQKERTKRDSLLGVLDRTKTAMGARLLRNWVELPLISPADINARLSSVSEWVQMPIERAELRECLHLIHDLERVMSRLSSRYGTARDMAALAKSFAVLPEIERLLQGVRSSINKDIQLTYDNLSDICEKIQRVIVDTPAPTTKEGGMIRNGHDAELDRLTDIRQNAQKYLEELEIREKTRTGINTLKVRFNRVFGYYIEVTASHLAKVPADYIRKQTLANCERFITEELKKLEDTLLSVDEKIIELEFVLFDTLRREIIEEIARIQFTAYQIATIDTLQSLADAAERNQYVKPTVSDSSKIIIKEGRHPVVERLTAHAFVPNDTDMDSQDSRLAIITGPNMAGKSTYMRQVALIVLMAQIGSFVPAASADIGVVDRIFTRVGASDDLATGQSTFMVEMTEVANILNNATAKSLVILDEIGRGTSTFDGLSIAWAVLEYICDAKKIGAKTLFATHYHELTGLEGQLDGVVNYCFTAQDNGGKDIVFLRKLTRGEAGQSYGIHVARLAGLPAAVLTRAGKLLEALNSGSEHGDKNAGGVLLNVPAIDPMQEMINEAAFQLVDALAGIEVEKITPLEAIVALGRLKDIASRF